MLCVFSLPASCALSHAWNWVGSHAGRDSCPSWAGSRLPKSQKSGLRENKIAAACFPLSFRPFRFKNGVFCGEFLTLRYVCCASSISFAYLFLFCLASLSSACHGISKFWVSAKCARDLSRLHLWGDHSAENSSKNYFFLILFFLFFCFELFVQWLEWTECGFSEKLGFEPF